MSLRCRSSAVLIIVLALAAGCDRERREYHSAPAAPESHPRLTSFQPGVPIEDPPSRIGQQYEGNAYHIAQGGRLFRWYNCNGCHGSGGGAIGPALMDDQWRYGGRIDQVHASILEGRPNGMPSWRGKLTDAQAWELAAYVRSLSGNVPKSAAPSRHDAMSSTPPLTQVPQQSTRPADPSAQQPPPP